jgi:hypothetical protein
VFVEENDTETLPPFKQREYTDEVSSVSLDINDISQRLSKLDPHKAPGYDGVQCIHMFL